jgi:hypothetical protein
VSLNSTCCRHAQRVLLAKLRLRHDCAHTGLSTGRCPYDFPSGPTTSTPQSAPLRAWPPSQRGPWLPQPRALPARHPVHMGGKRGASCIHARQLCCATEPIQTPPLPHLLDALHLWDVMHQHVLNAALERDGRGRAAAASSLRATIVETQRSAKCPRLQATPPPTQLSPPPSLLSLPIAFLHAH